MWVAKIYEVVTVFWGLARLGPLLKGFGVAALADLFRLRVFRVSTRADGQFSAAMRVGVEKGT